MAWCESVKSKGRFFIDSRFSLEHPSSTGFKPTVAFLETTEFVGSGMHM